MQENDWKPELFVLDERAWEREIKKTSLIEGEPAGVSDFDNALVLPVRNFSLPEYPGGHYYEGGVIDSNGEFVAGMARKNTGAIANYGLIRGYEVSEDEVEYCDEEVVFGGMLRHHYGHFLVDSTSRFWYFSNCKGSKKVVFIEDGEQKFDPNEILKIAGLKSGMYEIVKNPKRFKKVTVPEETSFSLTSNFKKEWITFFDDIRQRVKPSPYKKVYLTRTAFADDIVNEKYFEEFYRNHGFHVVSPEKLSLREQISLMAGADDVACTAGTLSHAVLFTKPETRLHLLNRVKEPLRQQIVVCKARGCHLIAIDAFRNYLPTKHGGCCVLLAPNNNWNAYIKKHFKEAPDQAFINNELPKVVLKYIEKWGERFQNRNSLTWVRDFDMTTLLTYINETKSNRIFKYKNPPVSSKLANLANLENLARQRGLSSQEFTPVEDVREEDRCLKMKGSIEKLPFLDWNRAKATMNLVGEDVNLNFPIETKISDDGKLNWETNIDTEILRKNFPEPKEEEHREKQIGEFVIAITSDKDEELRLKILSG